MVKIIELNVISNQYRKLRLNITITLIHATVVLKVKQLMMMEYGIVIHATMIYALNVLNDYYGCIIHRYDYLINYQSFDKKGKSILTEPWFDYKIPFKLFA